jgi:hypothetical protein
MQYFARLTFVFVVVIYRETRGLTMVLVWEPECPICRPFDVEARAYYEPARRTRVVIRENVSPTNVQVVRCANCNGPIAVIHDIKKIAGVQVIPDTRSSPLSPECQ